MTDEDYESEIQDLEDRIAELEKKNDALVDLVKSFINDAEYMLRKIGEM